MGSLAEVARTGVSAVLLHPLRSVVTVLCVISVLVPYLVGVGIAITWAFVVTYALLWLINKITPVRVSEADERAGLDHALHGETAYIHAD